MSKYSNRYLVFYYNLHAYTTSTYTTFKAILGRKIKTSRLRNLIFILNELSVNEEKLGINSSFFEI